MADEKVQEFTETSIPEVVMNAAKDYAQNVNDQIQEPLMQYIQGIIQAAFFSGAYWITHTDLNQINMKADDESNTEQAEPSTKD